MAVDRTAIGLPSRPAGRRLAAPRTRRNRPEDFRLLQNLEETYAAALQNPQHRLAVVAVESEPVP
jgi:hypothetical protein